METIKKEAAEAARVEDEVKAAGLDFSSYTRKFRSPVSICGVEVQELTFEYGTLTGRDHINAERECLSGGRNCIPDPKYDGDFLAKNCRESVHATRRGRVPPARCCRPRIAPHCRL